MTRAHAKDSATWANRHRNLTHAPSFDLRRCKACGATNAAVVEHPNDLLGVWRFLEGQWVERPDETKRAESCASCGTLFPTQTVTPQSFKPIRRTANNESRMWGYRAGMVDRRLTRRPRNIGASPDHTAP